MILDLKYYLCICIETYSRDFHGSVVLTLICGEFLILFNFSLFFLDFLWFFEILFSILQWWQAAPKKPINISWTLALVNPQSSQWDAKQSHGKTPPAWISPQDCGGNQMSEKIITRGSFPGVSSPVLPKAKWSNSGGIPGCKATMSISSANNWIMLELILFSPVKTDHVLCSEYRLFVRRDNSVNFVVKCCVLFWILVVYWTKWACANGMQAQSFLSA